MSALDSQAGDQSADPPMDRLSWSALTDPGRFRRSNEDAFLALQMNAREALRLGKIGESSLEEGDFIFAVSDGMGGHNAGEFASQIAVEKVTQLLPAAFRLDAQGLKCGFTDLLEQIFDQIHQQIRQLSWAYGELEGMGATLSLCWFRPRWMYFCHIGDSRIYFLPQAGGVRQVSEDHTHVAWLVKTGQITAAQARYHPAKNQLSRALVAHARCIKPQLGAVSYERGDRFLLCSDGLTDGLSDHGIEHLIRQPPLRAAGLSPAEVLVRESVAASGRDNTTAVVVMIE